MWRFITHITHSLKKTFLFLPKARIKTAKKSEWKNKKHFIYLIMSKIKKLNFFFTYFCILYYKPLLSDKKRAKNLALKIVTLHLQKNTVTMDKGTIFFGNSVFGQLISFIDNKIVEKCVKIAIQTIMRPLQNSLSFFFFDFLFSFLTF